MLYIEFEKITFIQKRMKNRKKKRFRQVVIPRHDDVYGISTNPLEIKLGIIIFVPARDLSKSVNN